jgi:TPP-dependent pyruvate/acetoin dehydrogenase alpha subunit
MWRIRAFEERVGELTRANEVHGLVHLSIGQEGVAAGVCCATTTPSTAATGLTGTRWPRVRHPGASWPS